MGELIKKFGSALVDAFKEMLMDLFVWGFEILCDIAIYVLESLSLPSELLNHTIAEYISSDVAYFLALSGLDQCMAMIGGAIIFRMIRKFVTFGLW